MVPENLTAVIPTLWAGMLIGISFIATPVKFQAPSLTLPVALDVGCVTFHVFSRIEWLLAAMLLGAEALARGATWRSLLAVLVAAIVLLQSVWLLPALERRAAGIIGGATLAPSQAHRAYGGLEGLKLLVLLALIVASFVG